MSETIETRIALAKICHKLHAAGLIAATDGNVSSRVGEAALLITPSGKPKNSLKPLDMLLVDMHGTVIQGSGKPSSEIRMHTLIYSRRPDVRAIVHAHPPMLTAFTLAGIPFVAEALPEVYLTYGAVPTAPYATPTTDEVPLSIEPLVKDHQAILLERHGSVTMGSNAEEAFLRLEKLEHAAHTLFFARTLAGRLPTSLPEESLQRLAALFH